MPHLHLWRHWLEPVAPNVSFRLTGWRTFSSHKSNKNWMIEHKRELFSEEIQNGLVITTTNHPNSLPQNFKQWRFVYLLLTVINLFYNSNPISKFINGFLLSRASNVVQWQANSNRWIIGTETAEKLQVGATGSIQLVMATLHGFIEQLSHFGRFSRHEWV